MAQDTLTHQQHNHAHQYDKLTTPNGEKKLLLHSCCAPCAGDIMMAMKASAIDTTLFLGLS